MTAENRSLLFAKIGFLAVLTLLIVLAGNTGIQSQQTVVQSSATP